MLDKLAQLALERGACLNELTALQLQAEAACLRNDTAAFKELKTRLHAQTDKWLDTVYMQHVELRRKMEGGL